MILCGMYWMSTITEAAADLEIPYPAVASSCQRIENIPCLNGGNFCL